MKLNTDLLSIQAAEKIRSVGIEVGLTYKVAWLLGVKLGNGQTVAAYPISRLNPLAPPCIYITDKECNEGVDNREFPSKIVSKLKKYCDDDGLLDAIKLLRKAIKSLESK